MTVPEDRKVDQQKRLIGFSVCESHHDQSEVGIDARPKIAVALEAGASLAGADAVIDEARADARNRLGLSGARAGRRVEGVERGDAEERDTLKPHLQKKMQTLGTMPQAEQERLLPLARQVLGQ